MPRAKNRKRKSAVMSIFLTCLVAGLAFIGFVRYLECTSVFYPAKQLARTPADLGLAYDDVQLTTLDNKYLHGWLIDLEGAKTTLLFLHGNAGNIADRLEKIMLFREMGLNVFIVDYRGYGNSTGRPTEKGMYTDATAAYEYLVQHRQRDPKNVVLYGESLGAAAAIDLASQYPVAGLIVDSAFSSAKDMGKVLYPFVPSFMVGLKMDSASKAGAIKVPKLFLHSKTDEIVPYELGRKLFEAAAEPKEFLEMGGGHNDGFFASADIFVSGIKNFLTKHRLL